MLIRGARRDIPAVLGSSIGDETGIPRAAPQAFLLKLRATDKDLLSQGS
jgi:hypothetical protein